MDSRNWLRDLPDEVLYDLRAAIHYALHGTGLIPEPHDDSGEMLDPGTAEEMTAAVVRLEEEIVEESMHRWT